MVLRSGPKYAALLQINMTLIAIQSFLYEDCTETGKCEHIFCNCSSGTDIQWFYNLCREMNLLALKSFLFSNFSPKAWLLLKFCFKRYQLLPTATISALQVNLRLKLKLISGKNTRGKLLTARCILVFK